MAVLLFDSSRRSRYEQRTGRRLSQEPCST